MNLLCIDRWSQNIGLAYSLDDVTVLPLWSLPNDADTLLQIAWYLHLKHIDRIVVWLPKDIQTQQSVGRFVKELQTLLEVGQDVVYFNEDYSTIQAMAEFPNQSKNAQDTISAMKILSEYIKHRGAQ